MKQYEELANAIILQAVRDYRSALKSIKKYGKNKDAENTKCECESFFRSGWYRTLTQVDGEMLISALRAEVGV